MARVLGIRANTVIAAAFALSGLLAGTAAILLTAQTGTVSPTIGVNIVLVAFVATIVGGMGSLRGAVLGGFLIGALTVTLQATLPLDLRPYRDAFVFAAVLAVLVVRPQGLLPARATLAREEPNRARLRWPVVRPRSRAGEAQTVERVGRSTEAVLTETVWPPAALIAITFLVAIVAWMLGPDSLDRVVIGMVINTILVVGLYTFVGVSGVFSFGHAAFMAIGAYAGAILVIPRDTKTFVLPGLPDFLARAHLAPLPATIVAGAIAAAVALVISLPLARLSGLTAGLATFAVLSIVNVVSRNWEQLTHGTAGVSGIPTTTTIWVALAWAAVAIAAAWAFQRSRVGLRLRASRENEAGARSIGIGVAGERTIAFVLSAFLAGVAGALLGMFIGSFNPDAFFLNITFLMVAMLIIGGMTSLAGAVIGTIVISSLSELLRRLEGGADLGLVQLSARPGLRDVGLALVMLAVLILRPNGLTGGRELTWPRRNPRVGAFANAARICQGRVITRALEPWRSHAPPVVASPRHLPRRGRDRLRRWRRRRLERDGRGPDRDRHREQPHRRARPVRARDQRRHGRRGGRHQRRRRRRRPADRDHPRRRQVRPQPGGDSRARGDREGRGRRRPDVRRGLRRPRRPGREREGDPRDHLRRRARHRPADGRPAHVQHVHRRADRERARRRVRVPDEGLAQRLLPLRPRVRVHEGRLRGVQDPLAGARRRDRRRGHVPPERHVDRVAGDAPDERADARLRRARLLSGWVPALKEIRAAYDGPIVLAAAYSGTFWLKPRRTSRTSGSPRSGRATATTLAPRSTSSSASTRS